jgi:hypothetical protein
MSAQQQHSNSLFPANIFLSFVGEISSSEQKLLKWDFNLKSIDKKDDLTVYNYRIDHSYNRLTGLYQFDSFMIESSDSPFIYTDQFTYVTSKNSNFLNYKRKLIEFGFTWIDDPGYYTINFKGEFYLFKIGRAVHDSGTPNYIIEITRIRKNE